MIRIIIGIIIGYFLATTAIGQEMLPAVQNYSVEILQWITNTVRSI
tara:strand:- start:245 stop:382 length:138 start_codon:yes stop_codon:yes gene_type:complete